MDEFRENLKSILRVIDEPISMYDIAKQLDMHVDDFLGELKIIQVKCKDEFKKNFRNMIKPNNKEFMESFFKDPDIDLGFLVQHKIKEVSDALKEQHNSMGHKMFYDSWILYRGY